MDYNEVLETARTKIGTKCKACPICNGVACRNTMPGPGAKGIGYCYPQLSEMAGDPCQYGYYL